MCVFQPKQNPYSAHALFLSLKLIYLYSSLSQTNQLSFSLSPPLSLSLALVQTPPPSPPTLSHLLRLTQRLVAEPVKLRHRPLRRPSVIGINHESPLRVAARI